MLVSTEVHPDGDELCHRERDPVTWSEEQKELKSLLNLFFQLKPQRRRSSFFAFLIFFVFPCLFAFLTFLPFSVSLFPFFFFACFFSLCFSSLFFHLKGSPSQPRLGRTSSPLPHTVPLPFLRSFSSHPWPYTENRPQRQHQHQQCCTQH